MLIPFPPVFHMPMQLGVISRACRAAEERRKYPPRKLVSIMHEKEKYHHVTSSIRPKLLTDAPGNLVLSHYAVVSLALVLLSPLIAH